MELNEQDRRLIAEIQGGLPLVPDPFEAVGHAVGMSEDEVIQRLQELLDAGIIKRLGVVVRHHELGYQANAMTVWNVPDDQVDAIARRMAATGLVSLCYRRPRRPGWPYNLFCMIHGKTRDEALNKIDTLWYMCGLKDIPYEVLFSTRRFKQRGARYVMARA
ncbi:MAG TPA: hypothetical protein V6D05_16715 [Stenomitos sp.]